MLRRVKFLGHEIGYNTLKPSHSKVAAIHKILSSTGKIALMSFIGALNFYTKLIEKLHINLKLFYDGLHENTPRQKMKVISYNSRLLNPQEQKFSTLDRELLGIVHALQRYEFLIIGSPHPIHVFTDHKPLLHCFTKK